MERLLQKSKWDVYTVLEGSLTALGKTGQRGYFLDMWIKINKDMERAGAIHVFGKTERLFWISYIYIYTAQTSCEAWKFMFSIAHCISRKLRSWSACSRQAWFREKEIYSESFWVNPYFYKEHHELHGSATSAQQTARFISFRVA